MMRCQICARQASPFYDVQLRNMRKYRLCQPCMEERRDIIHCSPPQEAPPELSPEQQPKLLAIDLLQDNPYQPRMAMEEESLRQLAETIKSQGFQGVLVARPHPGQLGAYQLTAGHRRREAAKLAGLTALPVIVRKQSEHEMAALAATENIQREDLSALEEGRLFQMMKEVLGLNLAEILDMVKKDRGYVRNRLRLVNAPEDIQAFVATKDEGLSAAYYLAEIEDPVERAPIIEQLLRKTLTIHELPAYIEEMKRHKLVTAQSLEMVSSAQAAVTAPLTQMSDMMPSTPSSAMELSVPSSEMELSALPPGIEPPIPSLAMEDSALPSAATPPSSEELPACGVAPALEETMQAVQPMQSSAGCSSSATAPAQHAQARTTPSAQLGSALAAAHAAAMERVREGRLKSILSHLNQYQELIPEQGQLSGRESAIIQQILSFIQALPLAS